MQATVKIATTRHNQLVDITRRVEEVVSASNISTGIVNVYVQGATAGIMIQENWDESVQNDVIELV
jgi:secondary thiamine-phosphate synthase enzyme